MRCLVWSGLLIFLFACSEKHETEDFPLQQASDYYPLRIGNSWTYAVDSIQYDLDVVGILKDSSRTEWRETLTDTFRLLSGELAWKLERESRDSAGHWQYVKTLFLYLDDHSLVRSEDNLSLILMPATFLQGDRFEPAAMIDPLAKVFIRSEPVEMFKGWKGQVDETEANAQVNGLTYNDVAWFRLADTDPQNLVERRYLKQSFARGIGLLSADYEILDTQCGGDLSKCIGIPWEDKAERGFILHLSLTEYTLQ